jgi:hypothetical protein
VCLETHTSAVKERWYPGESEHAECLMKATAEASALDHASNVDSYARVLLELQGGRSPGVSVPHLSRLLGVNSTTLNARFRRHGISVTLVGRTSFIPAALAVELARLHRYALLGWPTLQEASRVTGQKPGTLKAHCEKGRLEGHIDLTKRLRINPAELGNLSLNRPRAGRNPRENPSPVALRGGGEENVDASGGDEVARVQHAGTLPILEPEKLVTPEAGPKPRPFALPPVREPQVRIITEKDYGLTVPEQRQVAAPARSPESSKAARQPAWLLYDPDRPFSISECSIGRRVRYGAYDGIIERIIPDPFSPKIRVRFPEHQHPLMREVLLVVQKRRLPGLRHA